ncbi:MAG: PepSY domain-containing protein, partial [Solobacterium sp.]|nr:PepSY domain-containing protein [Solobacterium sp.]
NVNSQGEASQKGYIGEEAAIEKALAYVNANRNDVSRIEVDLDYENGRMVYELEFFYQNTSYEIEVDAISGEIAKYEYDGRRENTPQVTPTYVPQATPIAQAPSNTATITVEEAISLAMNHAGVNRNDAYDIDAEYEREGYYDVDFKANGYEYNYDVDASNGSILRSKKEIDD